MAKRKGLEVAKRMTIHVKRPCTIIVTASGRRRMRVLAPREDAEVFLDNGEKALHSKPLAGYVKRK